MSAEDFIIPKIPKDDDDVMLVVLFNFGNNFQFKVPYHFARSCIQEFRLFLQFKYLDPEGRTKHFEKIGRYPFTTFFYKDIRGSNEFMKEDIYWMIDFNMVCSIYWGDISYESTRDKLMKQELKLREETIDLMKKENEDKKKGDEWKGGGEA